MDNCQETQASEHSNILSKGGKQNLPIFYSNYISPCILLAGEAELAGVLLEGGDGGDAALVVDVHPECPVPGCLLYPLDPDPPPRPALDHDHRHRAGRGRGLLHKHRDIEARPGVQRGLGHQQVQQLVPGQLLVARAAGGQPDLADGSGRGEHPGPRPPHAVVDGGQQPRGLGLGQGRPPVAGEGQLGQAGPRVPVTRTADA